MTGWINRIGISAMCRCQERGLEYTGKMTKVRDCNVAATHPRFMRIPIHAGQFPLLGYECYSFGLPIPSDQLLSWLRLYPPASP